MAEEVHDNHIRSLTRGLEYIAVVKQDLLTDSDAPQIDNQRLAIIRGATHGLYRELRKDGYVSKANKIVEDQTWEKQLPFQKKNYPNLPPELLEQDFAQKIKR